MKDVGLTWIPISRPFPLPDPVREVILKIHNAGHVAYVVGGSVRDYILQKKTKDHDIATSAHPDTICELFPNSITVGKAYGVVKIPVKSSQPGDPDYVEVTTFREESGYADYRRPSKVVYSTPEIDVLRRDFTINGLYYDLKTHRILDMVGGIKDLQLKLIRCIGKPEKRFQEDALRLLRAIRFAVRFDFEIDAQTSATMHQTGHLVKKISAERIQDELTLILTGPAPNKGFEYLLKYGLLPYTLPELERLKGLAESPLDSRNQDVWAHTLEVLGTLARLYPIRTFTLAWAGLLHEIGKPNAFEKTGSKNFNNHENESATIVEAIAKRLKFSNRDMVQIKSLVIDLPKFRDVFQMRESTIQRWIREPHFEELLWLEKAVSVSSDGNLAPYDFCYDRYIEMTKRESSGPVSLVDGNDLIQLGMSPSPLFSRIIRRVEDEVFEGRIKTKEEALEFVLQHFVK